MGNCNFKTEGMEENTSKKFYFFTKYYFKNLSKKVISKNNFTFHDVIGRGGFGKVLIMINSYINIHSF